MACKHFSPRALPAAALLLFALAGNNAMAECEQPDFNHSIPDGKSASETEMAQAQQAVKSYVSAGQSYIGCLESEGNINSMTLGKLRNAVIDDMEQVAAKFNRQLRYYRKSR